MLSLQMGSLLCELILSIAHFSSSTDMFVYRAVTARKRLGKAIKSSAKLRLPPSDCVNQRVKSRLCVFWVVIIGHFIPGKLS